MFYPATGAPENLQSLQVTLLDKPSSIFHLFTHNFINVTVVASNIGEIRSSPQMSAERLISSLHQDNPRLISLLLLFLLS